MTELESRELLKVLKRIAVALETLAMPVCRATAEENSLHFFVVDKRFND